MISWKGNTCRAASCPRDRLRVCPAWLRPRPGQAAHRLAEGQQDLPAQHVEVVGRRGAVDHDPVAVVELPHLEVLRERLGGQGVAGRWPLVPRPCPRGRQVHSRGRHPSRHCSSAGTSRASPRSAPAPKSKCQTSRLAEGRGHHTGQKPGCAGTGSQEREWKALGEGALTLEPRPQERPGSGRGVGKASSEGPGEPARVGGREGLAEACPQHVRPRHSSAAHTLGTGPERSPMM